MGYIVFADFDETWSEYLSDINANKGRGVRLYEVRYDFPVTSRRVTTIEVSSNF